MGNGSIQELFAPFRASSHGIVQPLTAQGNAKCTYIAAAIKRPQANGMFTWSECRKLHRITFASTVSNAIIRKQRGPGGTIKTEVPSLYFARRIINFEDYSVTTACLRHRNRTQRRRRVINVHRLA